MSCYKQLWLFIILFHAGIDNSSSSNILLVPSASYGSLFRFIAKMADNLAERGHNISLAVSSEYHQHAADTLKTSGIHIESFRSSLGFIDDGDDITDIALAGKLDWPTLRHVYRVMAKICDDLFADVQFLQRLGDSNFDLIIACDVSPCSALLANYLERPFVMVADNRIWPMWDANRYSIPNNPAYIPCFTSGLTDKMNFVERVYNFGYCLMMYYTCNEVFGYFGEVKEKYHIRPDLGINDVFKAAELFIFNTDLTSSYPRPLMPNVIFLGSGYVAEPAKPLSKDLETFIESSGDDGVVIFSLGSFTSLTEDHFRRFAAAFEKLPQKVIAKYEADSEPEYLKNSSKFKLLKWIPQNDLLGHPKTKAFISHCGVNSIHETVYFAIPVVAIPLFLEQKDNANFLADKGLAVTLDVGTMTSEDLYQAIVTVISDPTYKENAERLSRIQRDTPLSPKETSIFWVEYIIRHGGEHLKSQAAHLNFFQYHSIDVIAFLLIVLGLLTLTIVKLCSLCCRGFRKEKLKSQ